MSARLRDLRAIPHDDGRAPARQGVERVEPYHRNRTADSHRATQAEEAISQGRSFSAHLIAVQSPHMKETELYWIEARTARLAALQAARLAKVDFEDVKKVARFQLEML